jgi:hypothetical protein
LRNAADLEALCDEISAVYDKKIIYKYIKSQLMQHTVFYISTQMQNYKTKLFYLMINCGIATVDSTVILTALNLLLPGAT